MSAVDRCLWDLMAECLEYPTPPLADAARAAQALVAPRSADAAALLDGFAALVERTPLGQMEELYTATFDLNGVTYPYVGYHLFGESYKRSAFLVALKERYARCGVEAGAELPDHVALVLRFLARSDDAEQSSELVTDALLPALRKMTGPRAETPPGEEPAEPPRGAEVYGAVLRALQGELETRVAADASDTTRSLAG